MSSYASPNIAEPLSSLFYGPSALGRRIWWLLLVTGVMWLLLAIVVFRFEMASVAAVAATAGVVFLIAGVQEISMAGLVGGVWRWLHALVGAFLVAGGVVAILNPIGTFLSLAALAGWLLLIKGVFDIVLGLSDRRAALWWLRLVVGVVEIGLAFVVSANFVNSAVFVISFVGAWALVRGVTDLMQAFQLRDGEVAATADRPSRAPDEQPASGRGEAAAV